MAATLRKKMRFLYSASIFAAESLFFEKSAPAAAGRHQPRPHPEVKPAAILDAPEMTFSFETKSFRVFEAGVTHLETVGRRVVFMAAIP
jgi:hypothetical protein